MSFTYGFLIQESFYLYRGVYKTNVINQVIWAMAMDQHAGYGCDIDTCLN